MKGGVGGKMILASGARYPCYATGAMEKWNELWINDYSVYQILAFLNAEYIIFLHISIQ